MIEPTETTIIRSWDRMVINCWWDEPPEWFNIGIFKANENGESKHNIVRLQKTEAVRISDAIIKGISEAMLGGRKP